MIETLDEAFDRAEGAMKMDGFDDCIVGVAAQQYNSELLVYDFDLVIEKLQGMGMDYDEALEFFEFNMRGAWVGEGTPLIMERISEYTL